MATTNNPGDELRRLLSASGSSQPVEALTAALSEVAGVVRSDGGSAAGQTAEALVGELSALRSQVGTLSDASLRQTDSLERNTQATSENTASRAREVAGALGRVAETVRGAGALGLTASPLIGGLIKLFTRSKSQPQPELPLFQEAAPIRLEAALPTAAGEGLAPVQRDAAGVPQRVIQQAPAAQAITIQVNAMDSRSFLDHSDEIARAVRQAMLDTNALSDVVGDR